MLFFWQRCCVGSRCLHSRELSSQDWLLIRIVKVTMRHLIQRASSSHCQRRYVSRCLPTWMTAWSPCCRPILQPKLTFCGARWKNAIDDLCKNDCLLRVLVCSQAFSDIQVSTDVLLIACQSSLDAVGEIVSSQTGLVNTYVNTVVVNVAVALR